jgi:hypothetical protein
VILKGLCDKTSKVIQTQTQHSHSWLHVPSRLLTKIFVLFYSCTCLRNEASSSTMGGVDIFWRRYVCCTVASSRGYERWHSVRVTMGTVHSDTEAHKQRGEFIRLILLFQQKEHRLKVIEIFVGAWIFKCWKFSPKYETEYNININMT